MQPIDLNYTDSNTTNEKITDHKITIYQLVVRLYGNQNSSRITQGTIEQNGCGKFNDINEKALGSIKDLGISHILFTGAIEHASMADYSKFGITTDDGDVVKGRAGNPFAIKDYYDVDPDLAIDIPNRMAEYENLILRTHTTGLKVLMDFAPNHVARKYKSDAKPAGVKDLGESDNKHLAFSASNNFYYLPGKKYIVPKGYNPLNSEKAPGEDNSFDEYPAKASGNNVFSESPVESDWFETTKLNYGIDYQSNCFKHFDPKPDTWLKMKDILLYWAAKGVDGFRCDMADMVPVEFWNYAITEIKKEFPKIIFIAQISKPAEYLNYINTGKFDYLTDKAGMYNTIRQVLERKANVTKISSCWREETNGISSHMLHFLENNDELRIASRFFAGNAQRGVPAMTILTSINSGPLSIYFGQELGEKANGNEGYQGDDGRTSLYDYWGVPSQQAWINKGKFDGGGLSNFQKGVRTFYKKLLQVAITSDAIRKGRFYELLNSNRNEEGFLENEVYSFTRFSDSQRLLVVANFSNEKTFNPTIKIPSEAIKAMGMQDNATYVIRDLLESHTQLLMMGSQGVSVELKPNSAYIFEIR